MTSESRSPAAALHDPAVRRCAWVTESVLGRAELTAEVQRRAGLDAAQWQSVLWHGGLHVHGARIVGEEEVPSRVVAGAHISVYWFVRPPEIPALTGDAILFENGTIVAVNKPPWLTVSVGKASIRMSLEHALCRLMGIPTLHAVHRLDRMTSGVNLFAKDAAGCAGLSSQFAAGEVYKTYWAWVHPAPEAERWTMEGYISQVSHPHRACYRLSQTPTAGGRFSHTRFTCLMARGGRALVRAEPVTGRTHQIRLHLAAGGTPIVGDTLYGPGYTPGAPWSAGRMQLHAHRLEVRMPSPYPGEELSIVAPAPDDWLTG